MEAELRLHPRPKRSRGSIRNHDRLAFHVGQGLHVAAWVGHQHLRVLLEDRHHRLDLDALAREVERDERVRADAEIGRPTRQHLRHVHARSAFENAHVQAVLLIESQCERLIEAAMLGLRFPIGDESDVGRSCHLLFMLLAVVATRQKQGSCQQNPVPHSRFSLEAPQFSPGLRA